MANKEVIQKCTDHLSLTLPTIQWLIQRYNIKTVAIITKCTLQNSS